MDNLPNEVLFMIFDWSTPIYICHLGKCNKKLRQLSILNFNLHLKKRITTFNINTDLIKLINKNCVISGSFMLQLLKNVNYESDIDIYVKKDYEFDIINFLNVNNFKQQEKKSNYKINYNNTLRRINYESSYNFYSNWGVSSYIDSFGNKIDLIITGHDQLGLIKAFDLNIVKNYYDGNIYYNSYLTNDKLQVIDMNFSANNRIDHFKRVKRIKKYLIRGFNFKYSYQNNVSLNINCHCHSGY